MTVRGGDVQLRYPTGVRSVIDADLALRGNYQAPTLTGTVTVKSAVYSRRIDESDLLELVARRAGTVAPRRAPAQPRLRCR